MFKNERTSQRRIIAPALAAAVALTACGTGTTERPSPTQASTPKKEFFIPRCNGIKPSISNDPYTVTFSLDTTNTNIPETQSVDYSLFNFGDNSPESKADGLIANHQYKQAGTYTVNASVKMDFAEPGTGAKYDSIGCPPQVITVPFPTS